MASDSEEDEWPMQVWIEGESQNELAPYQGSQPETVKAVLELANVTKDDIVYDLGCGDARIPIYAAQHFGCVSVGVEFFVFDKAQTKLANFSSDDPAEVERVNSLVKLRKEDAVTCDMSDCTVCIMFLLPEGLKQIGEKLEKMIDEGVRIVTVFWGIKSRIPTKTMQVNNTTLYLYTKESEKAQTM